MTCIGDLKYDRFVNDMNSHFSRVKVINFDIIYHQCGGDKLQNTQYYETISNNDFENFESHIQNQAVSSAIRNERDDIYFELGFVKNHIKIDLVSNGFCNRNNKKKTLAIVKN